jgi:glycosyltransferase involved in cell wall biosynthesis
MSAIDLIRGSRTIQGELGSLKQNHVAYLGLYNPREHMGAIGGWLKSLLNQDVPLIVADNQSEDGTWPAVKDLVAECYPNSIFVQHPVNLGGHGSLFANLDLIGDAKWITTFHQDDIYEPGHLSAHSSAIKNAPNDLAIVSSEQESYLPSGPRQGYPRAHWMMNREPDAVSMFLANLRHHTLPFSGASLRVDLLNEIKIPWHSTAFPDTEIVLRMLPKWIGIVESESVVRYLENPNSESHSIDSKERDFGAAMALTRVFSGDGFHELCKLVEEKDATAFFRAVEEGLGHRIQQADLAQNVRAIALEAMFQAFGPHPRIISGLEEIYEGLGAAPAASLLSRLQRFGSTTGGVTLTSADKFSVEVDKRNPTLSFKEVKFFRRTLLAALGVIPLALRRKLLVASVKFLKALGIKTNWDFDWKK